MSLRVFRPRGSKLRIFQPFSFHDTPTSVKAHYQLFDNWQGTCAASRGGSNPPVALLITNPTKVSWHTYRLSTTHQCATVQWLKILALNTGALFEEMLEVLLIFHSVLLDIILCLQPSCLLKFKVQTICNWMPSSRYSKDTASLSQDRSFVLFMVKMWGIMVSLTMDESSTLLFWVRSSIIFII